MRQQENEPLVSVVMPSYNTPKEYLLLAVDSILNQTYKNIELILIDDGSDYDIYDLMGKYLDPRLNIIKNKENKGIVYSLNKGIRLSKGIYIARMDADDISEIRRIEKQVKYMQKEKNISIVGASARVFGSSHGIKIKPKDNNSIKIQMLFENPIIHPVVMFKKDDIIKAGLAYDNRFLSEDYALWFEALYIKNLKASNLRSVLLRYRRHDTQITTKNSEKLINNNKTFLQYVFSLLDVELSDKEIETYIKFANSIKMDINEKKQLNSILKKIVFGNYKKYGIQYKKLIKMIRIKYLKETVYQFLKNKDNISKYFFRFLIR